MRIFAAITLLIALLAGCGQTGPLYLPGEAPPPRPSTAVASQPAADAGAVSGEQPAAETEPTTPEN